MVSLDIYDVDTEYGFVRCLGKGAKERVIPIHHTAVAAVKTSPVFGGSLVKVDAHKTASMPGIVAVVELEDAVAVVADNYWHAQQALDALEVEFAPGPHAAVSSSSMLEAFEQALDDGDFITLKVKATPSSNWPGPSLSSRSIGPPFSPMRVWSR